MALTFNQILKLEGIDPAEVSLLRHQTDKGAQGRTPYTLWRDDLRAFERYQSTQKRRPVFRDARYWASFVSPQKFETLFVGLYEISLSPDGVVDWLDPLTDQAVGDGKPEPHDLFDYRLSEKLRSYIGRLRIDWDVRAIRSWAQYAARQDKPILEEDSVATNVIFSSEEGKEYWVRQKRLERDSDLRGEAIRINSERYGRPTCEACQFSNRDSALLDVHHPIPLRLGIRETRVEELEVLCPICHRYAHRKDALRPRPLPELIAWVEQGRP